MNITEVNPKKHIIHTKQFKTEFLFELFDLTNKIKSNLNNYRTTLQNKIVATVFYESSTRTRFSFESATYRLGGSVITTENAAQFSSASKGETLEDSTKVISAYSDFIVMRHYDDNASEIAIKTSKVPVINAGSGKGQHPTQALLDVYTIYESFSKLEGLKIALVGDLFRGRTVNSLVYLLSNFNNNEFYFVAPENSKVKNSLKQHLKDKGIKYYELDNLEEALPKVDVLYMTRVQKERFADETEYKQAAGKFILNNNMAEKMKQNSIIMHPLPRVDEINIDVDNNKRAKYFEQAENGLWVRMAILKILNDANYK